MKALHTSPTRPPVPTIATRSVPLLACIAVTLVIGCSGTSDENNVPVEDMGTTPSTNNATNNVATNNTTTTNNATNNTTNNPTNNTTNNPAMVTVTLVPIDASNGTLLDAEICVRDTDNCATGTAEAVSIQVPQDTDVSVTLAADGFITSSWYVNSGDDVQFNTPMVTEARLAAVRQGFNLEDAPTKGHVFFNAQGTSGGIAGVSLALDPTTFDLLIYNGANGANPALTVTEAGNGGFFNVDAGTYELTGTHDTLDCAASATHQQGAAGAAKIEVVAGEATYAFVVCE